MSIFGKSMKSQQRKGEIEEMKRRAMCQEEINAILRKYNLVVHATFQLVRPPKKVEQVKELDQPEVT